MNRALLRDRYFLAAVSIVVLFIAAVGTWYVAVPTDEERCRDAQERWLEAEAFRQQKIQAEAAERQLLPNAGTHRVSLPPPGADPVNNQRLRDAYQDMQRYCDTAP